MTLVNGSERLTLVFDCKVCEMHVMGKMNKHILNSSPPPLVPVASPVTFHLRRSEAPLRN